jgi:hypothetical protein
MAAYPREFYDIDAFGRSGVEYGKGLAKQKPKIVR